MKKKFLTWLLTSVVLMLLIPLLVVTFVNSDAGMAVCFLLFYAINPLYFVILGMVAGKNVKALWMMPALSAILFLMGTWIAFDPGETAFIMYAIIYLIIGVITLILSRRVIFHNKIKKNN